jgi:hypothetical protein
MILFIGSKIWYDLSSSLDKNSGSSIKDKGVLFKIDS